MTEYRLWITSEDAASGDQPSRCGIALYDGGSLVRVIGDLCCDRARIAELIDLFNTEELDPIHLDQAVEDFLYDYSL